VSWLANRIESLITVIARLQRIGARWRNNTATVSPTGEVLARHTDRLAAMTSGQRDAPDPLSHTGVFVQPDETTCGSSSLVMARMLNDRAYAMRILTGYDPGTGTQAGDPADIAGRFKRDVVAMHNQTSSVITHDGRLNGWWPKAWGTSPGAAARQMNGGTGLSGVPGTRYVVRYVDKANRAASFDAIVRAARDGHAVPVFTYDIRNANGHSGAHVTLVVGATSDILRVYEPGVGRVTDVTREAFCHARLRDSMGWDRPGAAVLPA